MASLYPGTVTVGSIDRIHIWHAWNRPLNFSNRLTFLPVTLEVCEDCDAEYPGDCPVHGPLIIVEDAEVSVKAS